MTYTLLSTIYPTTEFDSITGDHITVAGVFVDTTSVATIVGDASANGVSIHQGITSLTLPTTPVAGYVGRNHLGPPASPGVIGQIADDDFGSIYQFTAPTPPDTTGQWTLIGTNTAVGPTGPRGPAGDIANRNRPRKLIPSLQGFRRIGTVLKNDASWKNQYAGIGMDVVWDPDTQRWAMIYCGFQTGVTTTFGLAYSDNGVDWSDYGSNPIFGANGTAGQPDSGGVTFPQLVRYNGLWYMFYIGFSNPGYENSTPTICYATTPSLYQPSTWTRHGAAITIASFPAGISVVYRPTVIQVGSTWYLFTNAGPTVGDEDIWYFTASSPDGPWTVGQQVVSGDLFSSGTVASDPEIIRFGDWFVLLCWSNLGLQYAYCDISEFPGTWHANPTVLPLDGAGGAQRPVWVDGPAGPLLFINAQGATCVDLYVPRTSALASGAVRQRLNASGRFYRAGSVSTVTTAAAGDGFVTLQEFSADMAMTVTSLSVNVTVAAGAGVVRLGVYGDDGTGQPGSLLLDAGTVSVTSTGVKTISGLTLRLKPGRYWIAAAAQGGSPTLTAVATGSSPAATSATISELFGTWFGYYGSGYTGAFPATATGIAAAVNPIPLIVVGT